MSQISFYKFLLTFLNYDSVVYFKPCFVMLIITFKPCFVMLIIMHTQMCIYVSHPTDATNN